MNESIYIAIISSTAAIGIIITAVILLQVRNQRRLLKKQAELAAAAIAHQKELLQAVIQSQEAERQRIGSDLHDEVGATLSSLRMLIEKNSDESSRDNTFTHQSKTMIDGVIKNVRTISHQLSPQINGQHGFYDSLLDLCDHINAGGQLKILLELEEGTIPAGWSAGTCMAIYRVIAELLNNTIKHAQAHNATIRFLHSGHQLLISYEDDGIGFTQQPHTGKGMGLQNIESRLNMIKATWEITGTGKKGFGLTASVPV
ncbi:MAG: histidine kinase [Ferruginibacter sp.]